MNACVAMCSHQSMSNAAVAKALYRACLRFSSAVDGVPFELLSRDAKLLCPHSPLAAVVATQGSQQIRWLAEHEFRQCADHQVCSGRLPASSCCQRHKSTLQFTHGRTAAQCHRYLLELPASSNTRSVASQPAPVSRAAASGGNN